MSIIPYYKSYTPTLDFNQIMKSFQKIKKTNFKNNVILVDWKTSVIFEYVVDYFTEECRWKCKVREKEMSPWDYYLSNYKSSPELIEPSSKSILEKARKDILSIGQCSHFSISVAYKVCQIFKASNWLDMSGGWGDRLLSALLQNINYTSTDPNSCLHPGYKSMIDYFTNISINKSNNKSNKSNNKSDNKKLKIDPNQYLCLETGFENIDKPPFKNLLKKQIKKYGLYDLFFSSPPFFDKEDYSKEETQSIKKFNTVDTWINDFMLVCLKKALPFLKSNCPIVLYMDDSNSTVKFVDKLIQKSKTITQIKYLGPIYYSYLDQPKKRPLYIWKKL
jgi:hypothetical protein